MSPIPGALREISRSIVDVDTVEGRVLLLAADEFAALLTVEASLRAVVDFVGGAYGLHAREALARVDEVRGRSATRETGR